jgi:hypothetical protein
MCLVCILLLLLIQLPLPFPDMPSNPGIYFRQQDGTWLNLRTASLSGMRTKGLKAFIQTDGFSGFETDFVCDGAHAGTRIKLPKPVFYVLGLGTSKDIMLLQFERKKENRRIHASPVDATIVNKGGFRKNAIRKLETTVYSDQSFSVTPQEALKSGEYLLIIGQATNGYDFGID